MVAAYTSLDSIQRPSLDGELLPAWGDAVNDDISYLYNYLQTLKNSVSIIGGGSSVTVAPGGTPSNVSLVITTNPTGGAGAAATMAPSVVYDPKGNYSASEGAYICPQTGVYLVGWHWQILNVSKDGFVRVSLFTQDQANFNGTTFTGAPIQQFFTPVHASPSGAHTTVQHMGLVSAQGNPLAAGTPLAILFDSSSDGTSWSSAGNWGTNTPPTFTVQPGLMYFACLPSF